MARPIAVESEIAGRLDEPTAEMMLPDAIDHDACGKMWRIAEQRRGELAAAASLAEGLALREDTQEAPRHDRAFLRWIAAHLHGDVLRLARVVDKLGAMRAVGEHAKACVLD